MAEKNYGFFAGKISSVKKYMKENEVVRIDIDLITYRKKKDRWEEWDKIENLAILVSEKEQIQYLIKENASEGNMLSVFAVVSSIPVIKATRCPECGQINRFSGSTTFIKPLFLELFGSRIVQEIIPLTKSQAQEPEKYIQSKTSEKVTDIELINDANGIYYYRITKEVSYSDSDIKNWMEWAGSYSNWVLIHGKVTREPRYNPIEAVGGRVCNYPVSVRRRLIVEEDNPENDTDCLWVRSLGNQADEDAAHIHVKDRVSVDGYVQERKICAGENRGQKPECLVCDRYNKELKSCTGNGHGVKRQCESCGTIYSTKDRVMEILADSTEYMEDSRIEENIALIYGRIKYLELTPKFVAAVVEAPGRLINQKTGHPDYTDINIYSKDQTLIQYFNDNNICKNDLLEVWGRLIVLDQADTAKCQNCNWKNIIYTSIYNIIPSVVMMHEIHPKCTERILLSTEDIATKRTPEQWKQLVNERKISTYPLVKISFPPAQNNQYSIIACSQLPPQKDEILAEYRRVNEVGNRILISGNVLELPEKKHSSCTYQIDTQKKTILYGATGQPGHPTIRTFGRQAALDQKVLENNTRIFVDGYIHTKKEECRCQMCSSYLMDIEAGKEINKSIQVSEIYAYHVEYISGINDIFTEETLYQPGNWEGGEE